MTGIVGPKVSGIWDLQIRNDPGFEEFRMTRRSSISSQFIRCQIECTHHIQVARALYLTSMNRWTQETPRKKWSFC